MLVPCLLRCPSSSLKIPVYRNAVRYFAFDPLEAKMAQKRAEIINQQNEGNKIAYATKDGFEQNVKDNRFAGASDSEKGQVPTAWQKRFLVITKLYPSIKDIPPYVHHGTMNRMHDRMRVVFIVVACIVFFSIYLAAETGVHGRIIEDRNAGVRVG